MKCNTTAAGTRLPRACVCVYNITGKEFGCGIFVSSVLQSSKAAQNGLKVSHSTVHIVDKGPVCCGFVVLKEILNK